MEPVKQDIIVINQGGSQIDHPAHYGGKDNPYEAIKVIEAWGLNFRLGNCVKYIARCWRKDDPVENLRKAKWYLDREIEKLGGNTTSSPKAKQARVGGGN